MSSFATPSIPVDLTRPAPAAPTVAKGANAAKIAKTAKDFEASFITAMLQPMFDSVNTAPPFGGGAGEAAFKSFMVHAIAEQTAKSGGIGLAPAIQREMLKMQGAS
jgi:Rod binding domain-containing protein